MNHISVDQHQIDSINKKIDIINAYLDQELKDAWEAQDIPRIERIKGDISNFNHNIPYLIPNAIGTMDSIVSTKVFEIINPKPKKVKQIHKLLKLFR